MILSLFLQQSPSLNPRNSPQSMQNRNSNIQLGSRPSNSLSLRPSSPRIPRFSQLHFHYVPQEDQESRAEAQRQQIQPQDPQSQSLEGKLKTCVIKIFSIDPHKAIRVTVYLVLFFFIVDLGPLFAFLYDYVKEIPFTKEIRGSLEFMSANLETDPIMDIQIIDKKSNCPSGFEPLKFSIWNGTVPGCLCENGDLVDSSCRNDQFEACQTVPGTFPIEISELDSLIWCGKRAVLGVDYVKRAECPAGYKECYAGGCFLKGDCPITQVEVASIGEATKKFNLSKDKYLMLTRKQGELPLINIQITPNDIPYFNQNLNAKTSSYKLSVLKENGCDKYGFDEKFSTRLDSLSTFDAYSQNNFRYSTMNLPYFEQYSKNTISVLSWRTRMFTLKNDHCLNLDEKVIQSSIKAFDRSFPSDNMIFGGLITHFVILLFFGIDRCLTTSDRFFKSLEKASLIPTIRYSALFYLPLALSFFRSIGDYRELKVTKGYFEEFDSLGCFGEGQGSMVIRDYLEILQKGEVNFLMYFGFLLSNGLALLVCGWFWIIQKRKAQQNSNPWRA